MTQTPARTSHSSTVSTSHTKESVDPQVKEDMAKFTENVSVSNWLHAVCGVDADKMDRWVAFITKNSFFDDEVIAKELDAFCEVTLETARYVPLSNIIMRVLKLVQELQMDDIAARPPIDDIHFYRNDPKYMRRLAEQDSLAAKRKPDILASRIGEMKHTKGIGKHGVEWAAALMCVELKYSGPIKPKLNVERHKRQQQKCSASPEVACTTTQSEEVADAAEVEEVENVEEVEEVEEMANAEVAETASTGSKRSRGSEALVSARPAKKTKGATQSGGSSDRPSRKSSTTTDAEIQLGGYALEMLGSTRGTRMHNIGVIFRDELISLWYFDASGIVRTCPDAGVNREKLSLITDFERVAAIFVALAYCDAEQFGAIPAHVITPPTTKPHPSAFPIRSLKEHTIDLSTDEDKEKNVPFIVTLGKHVYSQYALVGRRTTIYEGTTSAAGGGRVIVKVSQQYIKRTSEYDIVEHARKLGIEHVPEFLKSKDLWHLSSGIRKLLATAPDPDNDRVLRCLVMDRYTPLSEKLVQAPDSLMEMAKQLITCIRDLRYKGFILHRDISEGNIMYQNRNGEDRFILIDFDLAVFVDENGFPKGATARHRTGTLPFMATELVEDMHNAEAMGSQCKRVIHCVKHDYESVFWVTLWCAIKIADPNSPDDYAKARNAELATWEFGTYKQIANNKLGLLWKHINSMALRLSPLFEHLRSWLVAFKGPFYMSAMMSATVPIQSAEELKNSFDTFETSGGLITYEKLLTTFEGF